MIEVPFYRPAIGESEIDAVVNCLRSGWLTTGRLCFQFEEEFAAYVGSGDAVSANSCTAALHLSLAALGIGPGDLVFVPTMTFSATAQVVFHLGATPVFVDCDPDTWCIDPDQLDAATAAAADGAPWPGFPDGLRGRAAAVIPVHFAGQMADSDRVRRAADRHDLRIVEDAAHTLPAWAEIDGEWRPVGWGADVACYSFYPNKPITTAEGGMIATDNAEIADRIRVLRLHGISRDAWKRFGREGSWHYDIVAPGYKYNLPDLCAALGIAQLRRADELWRDRCRVAAGLRAALDGVDELRLPVERPDRRHSWHLFIVELSEDAAIDRDTFMARLRDLGVVCSLHYKPLHIHPWYRDEFGLRPEDLPVANRAWRRMVSLPLFPGMTDAEIEQVGAAARRALAGGSA